MSIPKPWRAVLDVIEMFRDIDGAISVNNIVAFLTLCERQDVTMKELAFLTRLTEPTASRAVRMLEAPLAATALPPALGLVEIVRNREDARSRLVRLTAEGRALRDRISAEIETHVSARPTSPHP